MEGKLYSVATTGPGPLDAATEAVLCGCEEASNGVEASILVVGSSVCVA